MRPTSRRTLTRTTATLAAALATTALALTTAPTTTAATVIPCTTRTTTTPFTTWGDKNAYFTLPGGTFDTTPTTTGWTLTGGATITPENEPYKVITSTKASSLKMPPGATATLPTFCVNPVEAAVRFFYKSPGVTGSNLVATIHTLKGTTATDSYAWLDGTKTGWQVSPPITLPNVGEVGVQLTATITFTQKNIPATWQIDDFEVDPWKSL